MRLLTLGLLAFGPFTGEQLDLSARGLHVIYGPNEAGKSTALRAIGNLLYGIPERTTDDHVHKKSALRIHGRVERSDGGVLSLTRRKGRKNTLTDDGDAAVDEAVLERALGGVGRAQFETMFGLDHETLRAGGQALLQGEGDVGQSLFDAGGASGTGAVLARLRQEAEAIFKPTGKNPLLNKALADLKETKRRIEEQGTRPQGYVEQRLRLEQAEQEHAALIAKRYELAAERARLVRALQVLPNLAKRAGLLAQRAELGDVPHLAPDAAEQRREAQKRLERAQVDEQRLVAGLTSLDEAVAGLEVSESLVGLDDERMKQLEARLGMHRSAAADLPKRRGELQAREQEARRVLAELGREELALEAVDDLRLDKAGEARIDELMDAHAGLLAKLDDASERRRRLETKLQGLREQRAALAAARDAAPLRAALTRANRAGDAEEAAARARDALAAAETSMTRAVAALEGFSGDVDRALALAVPSRETVDVFVERHADVARQEAALGQRHADLAARRDATRAALAALDSGGEVPTEEQLASARTQRQGAWAPLRHALGQGKTADPEAYEMHVNAADALADRLRREADRVAERARLAAEDEREQRAADEISAQTEGLTKQRASLAQQWQALWRPLKVSARSPHEMLPWLGRHARILEQAAARDQAASELAARERQLASACRALTEQLTLLNHSLPSNLVALVDAAEVLLIQLDAESSERRRLDDAIAERTAELATLEHESTDRQSALDQWQRDFKASTKRLGLGNGAGVAEARAVLKALRDLFSRIAAADDMRSRVSGIERDARQFAADVQVLTANHAEDLTKHDAAEAAEELLKRWRTARDRARERDRLSADRDARRAEHTDVTRSREDAERTLAALMREAKASDLEALEEAERRAEAWRGLDVRIRDIENTLLDAGQGASLEQLEQSVRNLDVERVRVDKEELDEQHDALLDDIGHAAQQVGSLKSGLASFEERLGAFGAKLDEQAQLAAIRSHAEQFVRLRLAAVLLEREVERYRQQNQDPILARARQLFPKLTLGHYRDLKVGYDDGDEPELICLRGEDEVRVSGLSDGARDQLYLALRLASLERYADAGEMLPLVLDDILIHFDDERASAALEALAALSDRCQILFFTHHARLRDLARNVVPAGKLHEHALASPVAAKKAV